LLDLYGKVRLLKWVLNSLRRAGEAPWEKDQGLSASEFAENGAVANATNRRIKR